MKSVRTIWLAAVVLFLGACPALGLVEFKDGLTHDINYSIDDNVWVDYEAPGMSTTVNLLTGGSVQEDIRGFTDARINVRGGSVIGRLQAWESSRVDMSDGSIGVDLSSHNSSQVNISGGSIEFSLLTYDSSQVGISGGSIGVSLISQGLSKVNITGGSIADYLKSLGESRVDISGGSIGVELFSDDYSKVNISGGSIGSLYSYDTSRVNISGGAISNDLKSGDFARVDISGGSIGGNLILNNDSIIRINGSDFSIDGQSVGYGEITSIFRADPPIEPIRWLTGTLASGEPINNGFQIGWDARIILIPEPATIVLLGLGALMLRKYRK